MGIDRYVGLLQLVKRRKLSVDGERAHMKDEIKQYLEFLEQKIEDMKLNIKSHGGFIKASYDGEFDGYVNCENEFKRIFNVKGEK